MMRNEKVPAGAATPCAGTQLKNHEHYTALLGKCQKGTQEYIVLQHIYFGGLKMTNYITDAELNSYYGQDYYGEDTDYFDGPYWTEDDLGILEEEDDV